MLLLATSACSNEDDSSSASVCCSCSYSSSGWLLHCHGREFLPKEGHPVSLAILVLEDGNTSRPLGHHPEALDLAIPLEDMSLLHQPLGLSDIFFGESIPTRDSLYLLTFEVASLDRFGHCSVEGGLLS
jgi:hypothetical protein